ncbi:polyprenyl synthetase family protein [Pontivivens insulae]|uniref:Geranylgeranyl diphosphate synthase n=1 Tax=Pontivivens insulae TaxID=1639689 RepID=A0A2R8ADA0_9RHOB|nr:farnesyl diphosphate synthase [Pontivivens insulae]RED14105.1 farnesyl-diphosphate synthase [Pontivivens insulae]SPF30179.1 Farnesyl diphosphate synthase [Pontivivens insulae]
MTSDAFAARLRDVADAIEQRLDALLPHGDLISDAMRHGVLGGGKRLRGFLVVETAALFGVSEVTALNTAAAVECLHAYSLVHDDLPCMDDDDLRRGRPTVHRKWDEATGVLAGDALQTIAFEILARPDTHSNAQARIGLVMALAKASGQAGMVGGQAMDIAAETAGSPLNLDEISLLQSLKTGALIRFSCEAGAILGGNADARPHLAAYADALGLAFQIRDDLLDVEGDEDAAGKALNKDAAAGKATFVSLLGIEQARQKAADLIDTAIVNLSRQSLSSPMLEQAARFALTRQT